MSRKPSAGTGTRRRQLAAITALALALAVGAGALFAPSTVRAQAPSPDSALLSYEGADRATRLLAAAKKEGKLTLYTAFRPQDLPALIEPFEKQTGIKVTAWRSGATNVLQRVLSEAAGERHEVDVVLMPSTEMEALRREKRLAAVKSPYTRNLVPAAVPSHGEWAPVLLNVLVPTYNTKAVKKEDLPKTYADLLDPKWKGKLAVESKLDEWYLTLITSMADEKDKDRGARFFTELAAKNGLQSRLGMSLLNNLVISGEVPLALAVYRDLPEKAKRKGATIDSFVLDPIVAQAFVGAIARRAPRPNAALLFHDYLLSEDTQKLLASLDFNAALSKLQPPPSGARMLLVDPVFAVDNAERATKAFEDLLMGRNK